MIKHLKSLAAVFTLAAVFFAPKAAMATDPTLATLPFSISSATTSQWLQLANQATCAVTFTAVGSGATITVQGASDNVPTPQTVTGIGTSGVITNPSANSQYGGSIVPQALTYIRLSFSGVTGTYTGTVTCSGAAAGGGSGSGGTITGPLGAQTQAASVATTTNGLCASGGSACAPVSSTTGLGTNIVAVGGVTMSSGMATAVLPTNTSWAASATQSTGCDGQTTGGSFLTKKTLSISLSASTSATQIVALSGSTAIHICHIDISGTISTGAVNGVSLIGGSGTNCATSPQTFWEWAFGTTFSGMTMGDGSHGLFDVTNSSGTASGMALCYSTGAWVATVAPVLNITYIQF